MLASGTMVGRYLIRRKLAEGGMAEIYLASAVGAEGFTKDVVIKVVHHFLGDDPQFVEMFIAEARLASRLNHANVVQIFDFGTHEHRYFLTMEYVHGVSLTALRRRCQELSVAVPPTLVAEIGAQVARGLQYAHGLSEGRRSLGVVHRDVTPHNILLSFEGAVKLTDFGIAKAASTHTAPGILKGKFAYMSPEQSRGERVDARSDVFSLGIVLWEFLTGERLFTGESDVSVLRAVQDRVIVPPMQLNPRVPQELSEVVMRALSRNLELRFKSAQEMARALSSFVLHNAESVDDVSVAQFIRPLFRKELERERPSSEVLPTQLDGRSFGSGETCFRERLGVDSDARDARDARDRGAAGEGRYGAGEGGEEDPPLVGTVTLTPSGLAPSQVGPRPRGFGAAPRTEEQRVGLASSNAARRTTPVGVAFELEAARRRPDRASEPGQDSAPGGAPVRVGTARMPQLGPSTLRRLARLSPTGPSVVVAPDAAETLEPGFRMPEETQKEPEEPVGGSQGLYLETETPQPQLPEEDALEPEAHGDDEFAQQASPQDEFPQEELAHEAVAHEEDLLALRRGPSALRLVLALVALAVAAGAVTLAIWPAEEASAEVPMVMGTPPASPASPALHPPSPLPAVEGEAAATPPKPPNTPAPTSAEAITPADAKPAVTTPAATKAMATKPMATKPAEAVVRAAPRVGQLMVKAIPFAYVSANGRQLGEAFGSQTYELKVGTYDVELVHPRKRLKKAITIRAGEPTRLDFNALE